MQIRWRQLLKLVTLVNNLANPARDYIRAQIITKEWMRFSDKAYGNTSGAICPWIVIQFYSSTTSPGYNERTDH